ALEALKGLKAQSDEMQLDQLAETYRSRLGRYPQSTRELVEAAMIKGIPLDPDGFPFVFVTQRFHRIQRRRLCRRPDAKYQPDSHRHRKPDDHCPKRHNRFQRTY